MCVILKREERRKERRRKKQVFTCCLLDPVDSQAAVVPEQFQHLCYVCEPVHVYGQFAVIHLRRIFRVLPKKNTTVAAR